MPREELETTLQSVVNKSSYSSSSHTYRHVAADVADARKTSLAQCLRNLKRRRELLVGHESREGWGPACAVEQQREVRRDLGVEF